MFNQGCLLLLWFKQVVDSCVLCVFMGDLVCFGFLKFDYCIYELYLIVNIFVLYYFGQGDLCICFDVECFDGVVVWFCDGSVDDYDFVFFVIGYMFDYLFVVWEYLYWCGVVLWLFLNIFFVLFNGLFVMGMIEVFGIGWQGCYEQVEFFVGYFDVVEQDLLCVVCFWDWVIGCFWLDVMGGYYYFGLDWMVYYVNKDVYWSVVWWEQKELWQCFFVQKKCGWWVLRCVLWSFVVVLVFVVVGIFVWIQIGVMFVEFELLEIVCENIVFIVIDVEEGIVFVFVDGGLEVGFVFIFGVKVDLWVYVVILQGFVEDGVMVVIMCFWLNFVFFDLCGMDVFIFVVFEVDVWVVGGYLLGGVCVCQFVLDVDVFVLFVSYCVNDLLDS